jgi:hypothetical protein
LFSATKKDIDMMCEGSQFMEDCQADCNFVTVCIEEECGCSDYEFCVQEVESCYVVQMDECSRKYIDCTDACGY